MRLALVARSHRNVLIHQKSWQISKRNYHLNEPLHKQYFLYLENLSKGDFGPSFKYKDQSVNDLIASAFPVSLKLGMVAFALRWY